MSKIRQCKTSGDLMRASECVTALAGLNPSGVAALIEAAEELHLAEGAYRQAHDLHGDGSAKAGRAWDLMRRASAKVATALAAVRGEG